MFDFLKKTKKNRGFTYVELIVVLGIFTVMLSVALFNYKGFEGKVDIKSLASDIALKVVEAQKSSVGGRVSALTFAGKPSYGVYFNTTTSNKFVYYADLNASSSCDDSHCTPPGYSIGGEVLDVVNITKGNTISGIKVYGSGCSSPVIINGSLSVLFKRPSSSATIVTSPSSGCSSISYAEVDISSPISTGTYTSNVKIYPSGRIQIN